MHTAAVRWANKFRLPSGSWVFVPTKESLRRGRYIKALVQRIWTPPSYFFHHQRGGHVEALKSHVDGKYFVRADLQKFFNRISRTRVTRELKPLLGYNDARAIAVESTVPIVMDATVRHVLPFGFVQSSILASLCLYKSRLGRVIRELNHNPGVKVSVYVDDIIVSASTYDAAAHALGLLVEASDRSALPLNMDKLMGPAESVVAFNVDLAEQSLLVTEQRISHFIASYLASDSEKRREGILGYLKTINFQQAEEFLDAISESPPDQPEED